MTQHNCSYCIDGGWLIRWIGCPYCDGSINTAQESMMSEFQQLYKRFLDGELSDREKMYYESQGRLIEAMYISQGLPPLNPSLRNQDGYIGLALGMKALEEGEQLP